MLTDLFYLQKVYLFSERKSSVRIMIVVDAVGIQ